MKSGNFDGFNSIFATRFRDLIEKRGDSQSNISKKLKIARQTVSMYFNGQTIPTADKLCQIAEYFGVSADYLLGLSPHESNDKDLTAVCDFTGLSPDAVDLILRLKEYSDIDHANALDLLLSHSDADMLFRDINDAIVLGKHDCSAAPLFYALEHDEQLSKILDVEKLKELQKAGYNVITIRDQYNAKMHRVSKLLDEIIHEIAYRNQSMK